MNIVDRVQKICLTPNTEWPVIEQETTPAGTLISGYVLPLAGIGAVAGFIGGSLVGRTLPFLGGTYRVPITTGIVVAVFTVFMAVVGVFIVSLIINALAPTFGAQKNSAQALKVAVYSFTPAWVAGVLQIVPALGVLAILGALYGLYLLYLGLPRLMRCPEDKAVGYVAVVVVCAIVTSLVLTAVTGALFLAGGAGAGALGGLSRATGGASTGGDVVFDKNSSLGKLQELGKQLEKSADKIDAAKKSGDQNAQVAAAFEGLGTLLGGGRHVDPISIDLLKPFVPETFAGLPRTRSSAEKTGVAALMVSKAEASYGDGAARDVTLEVLDTGGASGLMGLASWASLQEERDDDDSSERTQKVGGRMMHEKLSKRGGTNEFSVVMGERFVVSAKGRGVSLDELKAAVSRLDLAKLEALKDQGASK
jgi:Yip1 domain